MDNSPQHSFHIPVMGLAYTIDSPIKVARFGISSVMSIIEDNLIEKMRSYYYGKINEPYLPISTHEEDYRAKRITDYLNLVNRIVCQQVETLRNSTFEAGSEIVKYFEMLPDGNKVKQLFQLMNELQDREEQEQLQKYLKSQIQPGSIDVNIMTKVDKVNTDAFGKPIEDGSDALTALRGYVNSDLVNSSVVLSAGMKPRLFNYMEKLHQLAAKGWGDFEKKIVIKVSDYRSALIQGKYLAKKGLWVSEFRIESGLNCGGHAFATDGLLLGPILNEFKNKRAELRIELFEIYNRALQEKGLRTYNEAHPIKITVQGGIGTYEEDQFLRRFMGMDSTGWGTPFLLVPEATTVDDKTLQLLAKAGQDDLKLSKNSPLGVRFHYLKGTSSDEEKLNRIKKGRPGSPCTEKYLVSNTEFTKEPICTASYKYQKLKVKQLQGMELPEDQYQQQLSNVLDKECLCIGLSNSAVHTYQLKPFKKLEAVTICPGPNIVNFSATLSLQAMVDHIYGRANVISNPQRHHMFIRELQLYIDHLKESMEFNSGELAIKKDKYLKTFHDNLLDGIAYYRHIVVDIAHGIEELKYRFLDSLEKEEHKLRSLYENYVSHTNSLEAV
ncbi:hypothetical protein [uncultured Imperialibacter sp.]|mgnify:CR=1 FL=1|uniref:hypothetical protein n=1 Tax=uncultured Imperialibacter sp. TaxID=1672639 RepID=UPI0030DBFB38